MDYRHANNPAPFSNHGKPDEIESLRAQLAEVTRERDELKTVPMKYRRMKFNAELQDENAKLHEQLLATLAHAARLVEAFKVLQEAEQVFSKARGGPWVQRAVPLRDQYDLRQAWDQMHAIATTPINFDALHEDRARTLEVAAKNWIYGSTFSVLNQMAAAHRAKKEGK